MFNKLFGEAKDFAGNAYGFLTNQVSHTELGHVCLLLAALAWFSAVGEYPQKEWLAAALLLGYLAFEILVQGWQGWDTLTDTKFFWVFGVCSLVFAFTEIEPGSRFMLFDPIWLLPWVAIWVATLCVGVLARDKENPHDRA